MASANAKDISPAERRRSKVRDSILEAAERTFAAEGEAGLSIRRLAKEVDYSPAALYKYFSSKEELIDELKEAFFERLLNELAKLEEDLDPETEYLDHAHKGLMTYMRVAMEKPHHYGAAFSGFGHEDDPVPMEGDGSLKTKAFLHLHELVGEGVALGVFRADLDVAKAAKFVWSSCHGLVVLLAHIPGFGTKFITTDETMTREDLMSDHVHFILKGLRS